MAGRVGRPDDTGLGEAIAAIVSRLVYQEPESFGWESPWSHGTIQHSARVLEVAQYAVRFPGDIAEIGCMTGATTKRLGTVAQEHGKRVIAVDPWQTGTQNCEGWEYEAFLKNIAPMKDVVDVLRMKSQSKKAVSYIKGRELCFGFVDGSHEYADCLADIMLLSHAPIICVDDVLWSGAVSKAFGNAAKKLGRWVISHPLAKEGYLVE